MDQRRIRLADVVQMLYCKCFVFAGLGRKLGYIESVKIFEKKIKAFTIAFTIITDNHMYTLFVEILNSLYETLI